MTASPAVQRLDLGEGSTGGAPAPADSPPSSSSMSRPEPTYALPRQKEVKAFYENEKVQQAIAGIIVLNFVLSILQREIDPFSEGDPRKIVEGNESAIAADHQKYYQFWFVSNLIFNIIFIIELAINVYGRWWREFWSSGWNKFDFIVVAVSVLDMLPFIPLPGPAKLIKMLRAFRVFRLFNRIESMRKIIASIMKAIPGVANAFVIQLIFLCIYAVLSVEFFSFIGCDVDSESYGFALTARAGNRYLPETDACWGQEYYGTFFRSLYTMFQVLTGESWSEAGARPAIAYYAGNNNLLYVYITYLFFYSFILVNQMTLLNVVVAVLMDGMSQSGPADAEDSTESALKRIEGRLEQLTTDVAALKSKDFASVSRTHVPTDVPIADEARANGAVQPNLESSL
eukprot:TRINITY_DN301_c0_g1_i3.p1 TRINITY_DN301_c0_g1~~TRINITY_DN301_c0_g1_i3.p1  ORF type:complete len:400 (+),score=38.75 TRINITY_DN301_c0_g1_i3:43-1242(+)